MELLACIMLPSLLLLKEWRSKYVTKYSFNDIFLFSFFSRSSLPKISSANCHSARNFLFFSSSPLFFFIYTKRSQHWSERCEKRGGKNRIGKKKTCELLLLPSCSYVCTAGTVTKCYGFLNSRTRHRFFFPSSPPFRCFARKKTRTFPKMGNDWRKGRKKKFFFLYSKDTSEFFFHPTELLRPGSRLMCLRKESREGRSRQIWQGCWTLTTSDLPTFSIIPWLEKKTAQTNGFLNFV